MDVDVSEEVYDSRRARSRFSLQCGEVCDELVEINNAFRGNLKTYYLRNGNENIKDLCFLLTTHKLKIANLIQNLLLDYGALKFNIITESIYIKTLSNEVQIRAFKTSNKSIYQTSDINNILGDMFEKLCRENSEYEGKGSGWTLHSVDGLLIRFSRYRPLGEVLLFHFQRSWLISVQLLTPKTLRIIYVFNGPFWQNM